MKIMLIKDSSVKIEFNRIISVLNDICHIFEFLYLDQNINISKEESFIEYYNEIEKIKTIIKPEDVNYIIYITNRKYENNFYYLFNQYVMILSIYGWEFYTNLPIENGIFYFIASLIALTLPIDNRHRDTTGCIYDLNYDKTAVDIGMRRGYVCDDCLKDILPSIDSSVKTRNIFNDLEKILNVMSNASKWNKSVIYEDVIESEVKYDWSSFENEIANIYRDLGAQVKQNINLSGFQIDILIEEETPSKQVLRSIVECKYHKNKIGNRIVNDFYRQYSTLKEVSNIDKAIMVSYTGFSQEAQLLGNETGIELLHYQDLIQKFKQKYKDKTIDIKTKFDVKTKKGAQIKKLPEIFTIMPFSEKYDDIYYLGIHDTVKRCGCICERVDQIEYVGGILEKIYDSIKNAKIVIAELTEPNPNVYYELGYAHALEKPVIPITQDISKAPFDVRQFNHITYGNIRDLREKLYKRIQALI